MELRQLEIYIAAVEERSFTAAANRMYISHSAVSRTVGALERELGVQLIWRTNRVMELTAAGEELFRQAKELVAARDRAVDEVRCAIERGKDT